MHSSDNLRVAAVQLNSTGDRDSNIKRSAAWMAEAADHGARLICLPENFAYLDREGRKLRFVESVQDGPGLSMARQFAQERNVWVAAGTVPLAAASSEKVTNSLIVWGPDGELAARYDKVHLFDIALDAEHAFRESKTIEPGSNLVTVDVDGWIVGLSVCYDLRFPEQYRALVGLGAEVLLVPSAFTAKTGAVHWRTLLRARAIENLSYVVAPAQWGKHNERRESWGETLVMGPWGETLGELASGEGVVYGDLSRAALRSMRSKLPALSHRRIAVSSEVGPRIE